MSKNNLIIMTAMEKEADRLKVPGIKTIVTGIGGCNVVRTMYRLKEEIQDSLIINIGYAGSTCYPIGAIVSPNKVMKYELSNVIQYEELPLIPGWSTENACYTADKFVETQNYIPLVDMELYYIKLLHPNTMSLKIVSDDLDSHNYLRADFSESWNKINSWLQNISEGNNG